jgi:hypothetical protein
VTDISIRGYRDENYLSQRLLGHSDVPAFIKRARRTQETWECLLAHCRRQYAEYLKAVRIQLLSVEEIATDWSDIAAHLRNADDVETLRSLHNSLEIEPLWACNGTVNPRRLRQALLALRAGIERFNRCWKSFLERVDLRTVNEARLAYNRYYVFEKECAVRSPRVATQGFKPVALLTVEELSATLPYLRMLEMAH